jgi:protein-glutamine gamma-glutamyltransferase
MGATASPASANGGVRTVDRLFEFSLLGMLASGYLALVGSGRLDVLTVALTAAALLFRALLVTGVVRVELSSVVVNTLTLAYIAFYPIDYLFISGEFQQATVHLVLFLVVTKILTARSERDYTYVKIIAFLELLGACLLSSSLSFFVFLALFLMFAVATFSTAEIRRGAQRAGRLVRVAQRGVGWRLGVVSVFTCLGILSLTAFLFFLLPRTARAAFEHLASEHGRMAGFSDEVTLGELGEVRAEPTPVMHVEFEKRPYTRNLKWRGAALNDFDGWRWYNRALRGTRVPMLPNDRMTPLIEDPLRPPAGVYRFKYKVQLNDTDPETLFFAGVPEALNIEAARVWRGPGDSFRASIRGLNTVVYQAQSYLQRGGEPGFIPPLTAGERREDLRLPPIDPRIPRLALEWSAGAASDRAKAEAIEARLRSDYGYTLKLLSRPVRDPLANFLFVRKKGHCEYFASAMAVMLRTLEIPSRVVTGFQSGIYNPISGLQVIRESDAHSWVEAYLAGRGWTSFDPTPADPRGAMMSFNTRLAMFFDAANTFWQNWVLGYDKDHQMVLTSRVHDSAARGGWFDGMTRDAWAMGAGAGEFLKRFGIPFAVGLMIIALAILCGPGAWKAWLTRQRLKKVQRGVVEQSDATLLYTRMLRLLERRGIEKPAWVTPNEFARLVPASDLSPLVDDLTVLYQDLRFGGDRSAGPRMMLLLERLEKL